MNERTGYGSQGHFFAEEIELESVNLREFHFDTRRAERRGDDVKNASGKNFYFNGDQITNESN